MKARHYYIIPIFVGITVLIIAIYMLPINVGKADKLESIQPVGFSNSTAIVQMQMLTGTNWELITLPPGQPPVREGHSMVYDPYRNVVVLFGGVDFLGDTWEWNGDTWEQRFPAHSPPSRYAYAMAYDSARNVTVLFGGYSQVTQNRLRDTWEWDGNDWEQKSPATSPSARMDSAMVFDSTRGLVVLFGGNGGFNNETWEWDGTNWTRRLPSTSPSGRHSHTMVYDSNRNVTVLFGGYTGNLVNDTWEWNGENWAKRSPLHNPTPRYEHAMAYDSNRRVTVLFGGLTAFSPNILNNETWEWDGTDWIQQFPDNVPQARDYHAMSYDGTKEQVILLGGYNGSNSLGDTWVYSPIGDYSIKGRITDNSNVPISGVSVTTNSGFIAISDEVVKVF